MWSRFSEGLTIRQTRLDATGALVRRSALCEAGVDIVDALAVTGVLGRLADNPSQRTRRRPAPPNDDEPVSEQPADDQGAALLALYDRAVPQVYGYLLPRCGSSVVAEDLTAETFLAAVTAVKRQSVPSLTVAWLVGVARHKLVDHWRREAREARNFQLVHDEPTPAEDPWDERLDATRAHEVLQELGPHHRLVLTLRYLDGLPVPQVADHIGRGIHATEALLVRARVAFRRAYEEERDDA
jgi:RNA polymerase sigma-70 factor, ECF subfamily